MDRRISKHSFVLESLRAQLLSERIPPGQKLPSIPQLMKEYNAGRSTVRSVLLELQDEGLVTLAERRVAAAKEQPHDKRWRTKWEEVILRDRNRILSAYFAAARILPPISAFVIRYCSPRALPEYNEALAETQSCTALARFMESLVGSAGVAVQRLMPMFLQCSALPYFWDTSAAVRSASGAFIAHLGSPDPCETQTARILSALYSAVRCTVGELASRADTIRRPDPDTSLWVLFPEIEQHYTRVLLDLLVRIGIEIWDRSRLLPSEKRLADHYRVSVSTVREALYRLEEAGFTRTINGRGTVVLEQNRLAEASALPPWLEQLLMCALDAGQLIALIMPVCALEAAQRTTVDDLRMLEGAFQRSSLPLRSLFHFIVHRQKIHSMRMILHNAGALCDWGFALAVSDNRTALHQVLDEHACILLDHLRSERAREFAQHITDLYCRTLRRSRDEMITKHGIARARTIQIP